jgi:hypothetical protein
LDVIKIQFLLKVLDDFFIFDAVKSDFQLRSSAVGRNATAHSLSAGKITIELFNFIIQSVESIPFLLL